MLLLAFLAPLTSQLFSVSCVFVETNKTPKTGGRRPDPVEGKTRTSGKSVARHPRATLSLEMDRNWLGGTPLSGHPGNDQALSSGFCHQPCCDVASIDATTPSLDEMISLCIYFPPKRGGLDGVCASRSHTSRARAVRRLQEGAMAQRPPCARPASPCLNTRGQAASAPARPRAHTHHSRPEGRPPLLGLMTRLSLLKRTARMLGMRTCALATAPR